MGPDPTVTATATPPSTRGHGPSTFSFMVSFLTSILTFPGDFYVPLPSLGLLESLRKLFPLEMRSATTSAAFLLPTPLYCLYHPPAGDASLVCSWHFVFSLVDSFLNFGRTLSNFVRDRTRKRKFLSALTIKCLSPCPPQVRRLVPPFPPPEISFIFFRGLMASAVYPDSLSRLNLLIGLYAFPPGPRKIEQSNCTPLA